MPSCEGGWGTSTSNAPLQAIPSLSQHSSFAIRAKQDRTWGLEMFRVFMSGLDSPWHSRLTWSQTRWNPGSAPLHHKPHILSLSMVDTKSSCLVGL